MKIGTVIQLMTLIFSHFSVNLEIPDPVSKQKNIEEYCYGMADFSVAAVEAREGGVPLNKLLEGIRKFDDGSEVGRKAASLMRSQAIKIYAQEATGAKIGSAERQRAINMLAANCIRDFESPTSNDELADEAAKAADEAAKAASEASAEAAEAASPEKDER